jgi:hypothetical protein
MSAALQPSIVPPEALAIIQQGAPKPMTQNPSVAVDSVKVQASAAAPRQSDEPQHPAKAKIVKERGDEIVAIVSATFRLPATIPPALLKASSERKLKKIQPFTQQGIVAEALTAWLQKNGYQV